MDAVSTVGVFGRLMGRENRCLLFFDVPSVAVVSQPSSTERSQGRAGGTTERNTDEKKQSVK